VVHTGDNSPEIAKIHLFIDILSIDVISLIARRFTDVPKCNGNTALRPGASTKLTCQAQYSGGLQPVLTWVRDGIEIDSNDEFEIMLAGRSVTVAAVTDQDDGVEYTCHMKFGVVVEQCRLQLDVMCKSQL